MSEESRRKRAELCYLAPFGIVSRSNKAESVVTIFSIETRLLIFYRLAGHQEQK